MEFLFAVFLGGGLYGVWSAYRENQRRQRKGLKEKSLFLAFILNGLGVTLVVAIAIFGLFFLALAI